jgi:hypothetical protein
MYDFSYNNYNQLTSHKSNTWNAGGFWFPTTTDYYNRYYYEEYGSTGVANKENTQAELKLYPVPAMGTMNMDLKWSTAQSATIAIFDMHGRVMSQWQLSSTDTYHKSIDVSQMPAGIYILKVQGAKDATIQQFTVAH